MNSAIDQLSALQAAMIDGLHSPEPTAEMIAAIKAPLRASATTALMIYRQSMQSTLINTLRLSYPTIERVVGKEFFAAAAVSFVRAAPSRHGDLDCYGAGFSSFLGELPAVKELPYLADLARLEWLIQRLHRQPEETVLDRGGLAGMATEGLADRIFRYHPRAAVFASRWPVARIWLAHHNDPGNPDFDRLDHQADRVLILATDPTRIHFLDQAAWSFFEAIRQGHSLLIALEQATAIEPAFDFQSALATGLDAGVFALPAD